MNNPFAVESTNPFHVEQIETSSLQLQLRAMQADHYQLVREIDSLEAQYMKKSSAVSEPLSDDTLVAGQQWRELKKLVMNNKYKVHDWYRAFTEQEKELVEALYIAQKK